MEAVQYVAPFCFWLLSEKGDQWRPVHEYLADMLKAFPQLPLSAQPSAYTSGEQQAKWALDARMLELYRIFGLIERNPEQAEFREADKQMMRRTMLFETMFARA
jgi:hypothetical protein